MARLLKLEHTVMGDPDVPHPNGLKADVAELLTIAHTLKRWGARWGFIIVGVVMGSGLIDGRAAKVLGAFAKAAGLAP